MALSGHASQPAILITTVFFTVLTGVVIVLRLITRLLVVRSSGWDDVFIAIAGVLSVAMGAAIVEQARYGMGVHIDTLSEADLATTATWLWLFIWLYYASLCFTKISILLQYLRIFPHHTFSRACYALLAVVVVWSCWAVFSGIFTCYPVSRFWKKLAWNTGGCLARLPLWYVNAAINITTDCATTLLPLPIIHSLEIPQRQRKVLMCVFAIGLFTCITSTLRLVYIYPLSVSRDITWNTPQMAIWSCVEANTAIVCSCVPTLKGLMQRFFPDFLDSFRSRPVTEIISDPSTCRDWTHKNGFQLNVVERSFDPSGRSSTLASSNSRRDLLPTSSRSDDQESGEAIVGCYPLPLSDRPLRLDDHGIAVQTSVELESQERHDSDPSPPKNLKHVRGVLTTHVSGTGHSGWEHADP